MSETLLRLFSTKETYNKSIEQLANTNEVIKELSSDEVLYNNPILENPYENGLIYKALHVKGFSIAIHKLGYFLINEIEKKGGHFSWGIGVNKVLKSKGSKIVGFRMTDGEELTKGTIIFSPGAYAHDLLNDLGIKHYCNSVLGMWLKIPDEDNGLKSPLKLARNGIYSNGACSSSNIIPVEDEGGNHILISSGHGFIGKNHNYCNDQILHLSKGVIDVARKFFSNNKVSIKNISYCIRPWTYTCLGFFKNIPTDNGNIIVTGGHNTGGFAQAPVVANAILNEIDNKVNELAYIHNPERGSFVYRIPPVETDDDVIFLAQ